eukprot:GILK01008675.1.p1 GENE.GILK01008675.1~~GILK01008675.1.p1  ORF type:complete len:735 (+),score=154.97 GILK01008675.1:110-2314(+)
MSGIGEDDVGRVINGYELLRPIGRGKFSIVFKARRVNDGRLVALKKIQIFDMMDPRQREKCLKEVKLLQSLDHPNIIKYLDSFIENNDLIIIIEWAEKGDLKRVIRQAGQDGVQLEEQAVWEYAYQIGSALKHMHEKRIMHRDIKPANIFLSADGLVKLGDLGLGRFFSSQTLEAFSKVGTPLYMSPEVLNGNGYDWKSDVWSLGCVVYELANLRSPFKSDGNMSLYDLFQKINKGEFPPVDARYSSELRDIVESMIRVDPAARADIHQVWEAATAYMQKQNKAVSRRARPCPFIMMEDVVEKLKLLNYESQFCRIRKRDRLTRTFFAMPFHPPHVQLQYLYELVEWLLCLSAGKPNALALVPGADKGAGGGGVSIEDDPNVLAKQLLAETRESGLKLPPELSYVHIKQGYGEAVTWMLNELLNRELKRRNFEFGSPLFKDEEVPEDVQDSTVSCDEIQEETAANPHNGHGIAFRASCDDAEDMDVNALADGWFHADGDRVGAVISPSSPHKAGGIGPEFSGENHARLWRLECARVDASLGCVEPLEGEDWNLRLSSMTRHQHILHATATTVIDDCQRISTQYGEDVTRITKGESYLNSTFGASSLMQGMQTLKQQRASSLNHLRELENRLAEKSREDVEVQERLQQVQEDLSDRDKSVNDSSQVIKLKSAIKTVKNDIRTMELRIQMARLQLIRFNQEPVEQRRLHRFHKSKTKSSVNRQEESDHDSDNGMGS